MMEGTWLCDEGACDGEHLLRVAHDGSKAFPSGPSPPLYCIGTWLLYRCTPPSCPKWRQAQEIHNQIATETPLANWVILHSCFIGRHVGHVVFDYSYEF